MNGLDVGRLKRKTELASSLVRGGNFREAGSIIRGKAWTTYKGLGLRRDLSVPWPTPAAAIPIAIRLLKLEDIPYLFDLDEPNLTGAGRHERINRLHMVQAGFARCYVAATEDDRPCYMQFLIGPEENDILRHHFGDLYPTIRPDEALLEGAFTPEAFRGQKIMPCAMAQIAERATEFGARWAITICGDTNIPSLKGCKRSGFMPYMVREETWRLFRQKITFNDLPPGTPYPFDAEVPTLQPTLATNGG